MVVAGLESGNYGLWISRLTTELPELTTTSFGYKICIYIQYGVSDIRPSTCAIPQFQFWLKKTLSNAFIKLWMSRNHNIMNLTQYYEFTEPKQ